MFDEDRNSSACVRWMDGLGLRPSCVLVIERRASYLEKDVQHHRPAVVQVHLCAVSHLTSATSLTEPHESL